MTDERETIPVRELLDDPYFTINGDRAWIYLDSADDTFADLQGATIGHSDFRVERFAWQHAGYAADEAYAEVVLVPVTSWGDYGGDDVGRSNMRVLTDEYPDTFITAGFGPHDGQSLYLPLDAEIPVELFERLQGLGDYPLLDESDWSELRMEIEQEDWESWARDDFRREITTILEPHHEIDGFDAYEVIDALTDEVLADYMWQAMSDGAVEHEVETATSGHFRGLDELAATYARDVLQAHEDGLVEYARELTTRQLPGQLELVRV